MRSKIIEGEARRLDYIKIDSKDKLLEWCEITECHVYIPAKAANIIMEIIGDLKSELLTDEKGQLYYKTWEGIEALSIDDLIDIICELNYEVVEDMWKRMDRYEGFLTYEMSRMSYNMHKEYCPILYDLLDQTVYGRKACEIAEEIDVDKVKFIDMDIIRNTPEGEYPYIYAIQTAIDDTILEAGSYNDLLEKLYMKDFKPKWYHPFAVQPKGAKMYYRCGQIGPSYYEDAVKERIELLIKERPTMIKPEQVEHIEDFKDIKVFTIKVSNVPDSLVQLAESENACNPDFFIKVDYDKNDGYCEVVTEEGYSQLYCIDDIGVEHLIDYMLTKNETLMVEKLCRNVLSSLEPDKDKRELNNPEIKR